MGALLAKAQHQGALCYHQQRHGGRACQHVCDTLLLQQTHGRGTILGSNSPILLNSSASGTNVPSVHTVTKEGEQQGSNVFAGNLTKIFSVCQKQGDFTLKIKIFELIHFYECFLFCCFCNSTCFSKKKKKRKKKRQNIWWKGSGRIMIATQQNWKYGLRTLLHGCRMLCGISQRGGAVAWQEHG